MECRHCGAENPDSYTFCDDCGEILTQSGRSAGPPRWIWLAGGALLVLVVGLIWALTSGDRPGPTNEGVDSDCCKVCRAGKACGDTCIDESETCTEPAGCACDGPPCCKVCRTGKACGDTCIAADATCAAEPGCACDAD